MDNERSTDAGHDARMEELERRLERLEDRRGGMERSRSAINTLIPTDARQHMRAAGREQLLAVRSLLDHWIGHLRDEPDKPESNRENIRID